jgi:hypothetical protein
MLKLRAHGAGRATGLVTQNRTVRWQWHVIDALNAGGDYANLTNAKEYEDIVKARRLAGTWFGRVRKATLIKLMDDVKTVKDDVKVIEDDVKDHKERRPDPFSFQVASPAEKSVRTASIAR